MSKQRSRLLSTIAVFWMVGLLCGALPDAALAGDQVDQRNRKDGGLVGAWRITVFPGTPSEHFSVMTVNRGGTMTDRFASGPGMSVASGVWTRIAGPGNFATTFEGFMDTDSDGFFDQRFRVRLTIQLLDGDMLTFTGTTESLTLDGTTVLAGPFPGILGQGTRMHVIPE
jgi:hypothetical protein